MLLAVLEQRAQRESTGADVYASVAGGLPGHRARARPRGRARRRRRARSAPRSPADLVAVGEVGLGGELRQVAQTTRRLAEAARLGFAARSCPEPACTAPRVPRASTWSRCTDVGHAVHEALIPAG